MSLVWNDEYDPSELDGFQVETELDWRIQGDSDFDEADAWLAAQDVPDWTDSDKWPGIIHGTEDDQ